MVSTVPQINISEIWQKLQVKNLTLEWLQDVLSLPRLVKRNSLHLCRDRTSLQFQSTMHGIKIKRASFEKQVVFLKASSRDYLRQINALLLVYRMAAWLRIVCTGFRSVTSTLCMRS